MLIKKGFNVAKNKLYIQIKIVQDITCCGSGLFHKLGFWFGTFCYGKCKRHSYWSLCCFLPLGCATVKK